MHTTQINQWIFYKIREISGFSTKFSSYQKHYKNTFPDSKHSLLAFTTFPYIQGVSDKFQQVLSAIGVKVVFKPFPTFESYLLSLKDPILNSEKSSHIHEIPCNNCEFSYIRQTK